MLALKLLWRNWRSGELHILSMALVLAVTVVVAVSVLTGRLQGALEAQGQTLLAGNLALQSSQPLPREWFDQAEATGLRTAHFTQFTSMVFAGDNMQLASVKAVSPGYPLLGELRTSRVPFATREEDVSRANGVPVPGEVWVDSRLLAMMDIKLGDELEVGEQRLRITRVVIEEPDRGRGFSSFGARVMMNSEDVAATGVIQPGSRVRYRLLLAGDSSAIERLRATLEPTLTRHQRVIDLQSSQRGLARSLETGRRFLLLAAMMGVLLAGVAIAMAARVFAARQVEPVALLKSLGAGRRQVLQLYGVQLLLLGLLTTLCGLLLGDLLQRLVAASLVQLFPLQLAAPQWQAYWPGLLTGLVCLLAFSVPPLWHLPGLPPLRILRRDLAVSSVGYYAQALIGLLALLLLVAVFSRSLTLVASSAAGICLLSLGGVLVARLLLRLGTRLAAVGPGWRLALAALTRNRHQSVIQIIVFGVAVMLLLTLTGLRTSLLDDWRRQLPEGAPNHFLLNIASYEMADIESMLRDRQLQPQPFYPMVRARLTHINGTLAEEAAPGDHGVLRRELNLSWAEDPGADNRLVDGRWWDELPEVERHWVSVEQEVAQELRLQLGDVVRFSVGGLPLEAEIASIRSVRWESMNPNFYFLLSPGALDAFSPMALTSVHIGADEKLVVNDILRRFPTVVVIEMDRIINQIQSIVDQVSEGVAWMLWVVLAAGFLVMWAAVSASLDERRQEVALLRALGSGRGRLLGSLWLEFSLLGFASGLLALAGAELMLWALQTWLLEVDARPHWHLWLGGLLLATLVIGAMGVAACRQVVTAAPVRMLQPYR